MQITNTSAALRPRTVWEAVDLGFNMAQHWWWPLYRLWLGVALPVYLLLTLIGFNEPVYVIFAFWWLKPAYEQLPLIYLSRALFKQEADIRIRSWSSIKIIFKQLIANLTVRRLSFIRSFSAPVAQLEGLSGSARQKRLESLTRNSSGFGMFTFVLLNFELLIQGSILLLLAFITPSTIELTIWFDEHNLMINHISIAAYFLAASAIAPFYISGGFSMYINRRTKLEGWDIEIEFRQLQERLSKKSNKAAQIILPLIILSSCFGFNSPVSAAEDPEMNEPLVAPIISKEESRKKIEEIMSHSDFGRKEKIKSWKYKGDWNFGEPDPDLERSSLNTNFLLLVGQIGEFIFWVVIALAVVWLLYQLPKWLDKLPKFSGPTKKKNNAPTVLFGLNIEKQHLPNDIGAEAMALFQAGKYRECMSLLYRASLSMLVNKHGLEVKDSHTEQECLDLVEASAKQNITDYFGTLTSLWIALAYGHLMPEKNQLNLLCQTWSTTFEELDT